MGKFGKLVILPAILLLIASFFPQKTKGESAEFMSNRVIVKYKQHFSSRDRRTLHEKIGVKEIKNIDRLRVSVLKLEEPHSLDIVRSLRNNLNVEYLEPDYLATVFETTNDPSLINNLQWGLIKIQSASPNKSAWDYTKGNPSVKIAILDTGIDQDHKDLKNKIVQNKNCTESATVDDLYGHGSHVAGIAGAATNNGIGVAGVGYEVNLINAKALGDDGSGYYSWIAECLVWAADNGAQVINMSLGGGFPSKTLEDAIKYAWDKGVVLVAAAGNSNSTSVSYPAYFPNVLSVAATDQNDNRASFSNYGTWVDVAAPGVSIYSTLPNHKNALKNYDYGYLSGTSMASPFVSGLAGLLLSLENTDNVKTVRLIEDNADRIAGTGQNWIYGRINAYRSIQSAFPNQVYSPSPTDVFFSPTPSPTLTPVLTPTIVPKNPFAKWCSRFPKFCS